MSEMEAHKGKLVPITNLPGPTPEDNAREICSRLGIEKDEDWYNTWMEALDDDDQNRVFYDARRDIWYEVQDKELEIGGFIEATRNEDGSYDYYVNYYNGGAGFGEVMQAAIKKADKGAGPC